MTQNKQYYVWGFVSIMDTGFCMPIFCDKEETNIFFQDVSKDTYDTVAGFSAVDPGYDKGMIIKIFYPTEPSFHGVGDRPVFGFQMTEQINDESQTQAAFGTRENLLPVLVDCLKKPHLINDDVTAEIYHLYKDNMPMLDQLMDARREADNGLGLKPE